MDTLARRLREQGVKVIVPEFRHRLDLARISIGL
jgi:hypothetical protein